MKVLLTGANGQLGQALQACVPAQVELIALTRQQLDITQPHAIATIMQQVGPQWVINAAAYTAVDRAEHQPQLAFSVNAQGVENLAAACRRQHVRLLHLSTDYVFDGLHRTAITEQSLPNPQTVYGRSKLAGEQAVLALLAEGAVILRTSGLYSHHGHNFVRTVLQRMQQGEALTVVDDQISAPTSAYYLSQWIWQLLADTVPPLGGVYHAVASGQCSWYEFALEIQRQALALGVLSAPVNTQPISTQTYVEKQTSRVALRPAYSVLDNRKLSLQLPHPLPAWPEMLHQHLLSI